jgi:hypothetical protein
LNSLYLGFNCNLAIPCYLSLIHQWLTQRLTRYFILFSGILAVGSLPTVFLFFSDDWQVLLLSFDHDGLAFEETVDKQVGDLPFKHVAGLVVVPLAVDGTPVIHVLHGVVDGLREGRDVVGVLQYFRDLLQHKDEAVHPDWA